MLLINRVIPILFVISVLLGLAGCYFVDTEVVRNLDAVADWKSGRYYFHKPSKMKYAQEYFVKPITSVEYEIYKGITKDKTARIMHFGEKKILIQLQGNGLTSVLVAYVIEDGLYALMPIISSQEVDMVLANNPDIIVNRPEKYQSEFVGNRKALLAFIRLLDQKTVGKKVDTFIAHESVITNLEDRIPYDTIEQNMLWR